MLTRRQFVHASAVVMPTLRLLRGRASAPARIKLVHLTVGDGDVLDAVHHGAAIGRSEIIATGALLRTPIEASLLTAADVATARRMLAAAQRAGIFAAVVGGSPAFVSELASTAPARGPLFVATTPVPDAACGSAVFGAAPTDAARTTALAAWRASLMTASDATPQVSAWSGSLVSYGADSLNERFRAAWDHAPDEVEWSQWFALKAVAESAMRSHASSPASLAKALRADGFDGHKGKLLRFDARQQLVQPLYVVTPDDSGDTRVLYTWPGAVEPTAAGACR
jgi:ABC-type branched-subunit amino acid transport system substrate-binding protein